MIRSGLLRCLIFSALIACHAFGGGIISSAIMLREFGTVASALIVLIRLFEGITETIFHGGGVR
jgi:hypothetical protein